MRGKKKTVVFLIREGFQYASRYESREKERIFFRDMCVEYMANLFGRYSYRCSL